MGPPCIVFLQLPVSLQLFQYEILKKRERDLRQYPPEEKNFNFVLNLTKPNWKKNK